MRRCVTPHLRCRVLDSPIVCLPSFIRRFVGIVLCLGRCLHTGFGSAVCIGRRERLAWDLDQRMHGPAVHAPKLPRTSCCVICVVELSVLHLRAVGLPWKLNS